MLCELDYAYFINFLKLIGQLFKHKPPHSTISRTGALLFYCSIMKKPLTVISHFWPHIANFCKSAFIISAQYVASGLLLAEYGCLHLLRRSMLCLVFLISCMPSSRWSMHDVLAERLSSEVSDTFFNKLTTGFSQKFVFYYFCLKSFSFFLFLSYGCI